MATIPLPALHTAPIVQPPNQLEMLGQLMGIRGAQQNQQLREQEMQSGQLAQQDQQLKLQQDQQALKDQQAFRTAMQSPDNHGKTMGDIADTLANEGSISMQGWQQMKKADIDQRTALASLDEKSLANYKVAHAATQELYNNAMNMPDDQLTANWPAIAQQYNAIPGNQKVPLDPTQPMTKQQLQQFGPMLAMHGAYLDEATARRKNTAEAQTAEATLAQKQAESQFYQQNGGAPGVPAEVMQQADWLKKNPGKGASDFLLWKLQHTPTATIMGNQLGGAENQDALDFAANNYRQTGQMPAGLARSPGTTRAIIARAAELDQQAGGAGIASNKATLASNQESLKKLQASFDQVSAFENTANKNIDMLKGFAKKVPDLGTRFADVPVRMLSGTILGSENMAAFKTALAPVQTEAAKILNSANLQGQLSDSSRHELQDIVDGNLPYKSLVASLNVLQQDFKNRHESYQQQIADIQGRIRGAGQPAVGSAPAGASQEVWQNGKLVGHVVNNHYVPLGGN